MLIENVDTILIVDDHPLVTEAISTAISIVGKFTSVSATSAAEMRALLNTKREEENIGLAFVDIHLPDANGVDLILELVQHHRIPVIVVSGQDDEATINSCMKNGAVGFVPKSSKIQSFRSALIAILTGGQYFPVPRANSGAPPTDNLITSLCERQRQILDLIVMGQSNKQISKKLCLAEGTVRNKVSELLRYFDVESRTQIILVVMRLGYKPNLG